MFQVGENIAYPMYGAGTIMKIEEKEVLGERRSYYYVSLPHNRMTVMVPVDNSDKVGVRPIIGRAEIPEVLDVLESEPDDMPYNWNRRYRENTAKLKTGDILVVAGVVRNLILYDRHRKISTGEKKLLGTAKQILESELMLAGPFSEEEVEKLVESHIH